MQVVTNESGRWGSDWDGHLEEWLALVLDQGVDDFDAMGARFPSDVLRDEFLAGLGQRSEEVILGLLKGFMFDTCSFKADEYALKLLLNPPAEPQLSWKSGYRKRMADWALGLTFGPHVGIRWALDLLPAHATEAIAAIDAYLISDWLHLPDGRIDGLFDAMELIRAYYIGSPDKIHTRVTFLQELTSRQFEILNQRLFSAMGYQATLTPRGSDGGRDVVAVHTKVARRESLRIECKRYVGSVGVRRVRELLGVVTHEKATKGVLVASSRFTKGAIDVARANPSVELINGAELVSLLNEHLGYEWPSAIDRLLSERTGPI